MTRARVGLALVAAAILCCLIFIVPQTYADSYVRIVRLSDMDGDVQIDRNTGHGFEKAVPNLPITQGVRLQTGANGRAEIEFENGSALRMTANSSVQFGQLSLRPNGERANEIRVNQGTVYVHYKHKGDESLRLLFGDGSMQLTKDVNLRLNFAQPHAQVAVFKGEVQVDSTSQVSEVKKNQTYSFDLANASTFEPAKGIAPNPSDDWDRERTEYLEASGHTYGSPYRYGYSDLYRYGSFTSAPGYGLVWVPANAGFGFDPYSNGYWSFYPGTGYVWVSGFAWGWTPYRYGRWAWIPAVGGWAWVPGYWNQWNTGVAVINPPPAWRNPLPPTPGSGTTVVVGPGPRPPRDIHVEGPTPNPNGDGTMTNPAVNSGARSAPGNRALDTQTGATTTAAPAPAQTAEPMVRPGRDQHSAAPAQTPPSRQMSPQPSPPPAAAPSRPAAPPREAASPHSNMSTGGASHHQGGASHSKASANPK